MPITSNEGSVLYQLESISANEGGVLFELDNVQANENGVLYTIFENSKSVPVNEITVGMTFPSTGRIPSEYPFSFSASSSSLNTVSFYLMDNSSLPSEIKVTFIYPTSIGVITLSAYNSNYTISNADTSTEGDNTVMKITCSSASARSSNSGHYIRFWAFKFSGVSSTSLYRNFQCEKIEYKPV